MSAVLPQSPIALLSVHERVPDAPARPTRRLQASSHSAVARRLIFSDNSDVSLVDANADADLAQQLRQLDIFSFAN